MCISVNLALEMEKRDRQTQAERKRDRDRDVEKRPSRGKEMVKKTAKHFLVCDRTYL